jgi:hypothetical protein
MTCLDKIKQFIVSLISLRVGSLRTKAEAEFCLIRKINDFDSLKLALNAVEEIYFLYIMRATHHKSHQIEKTILFYLKINKS